MTTKRDRKYPEIYEKYFNSISDLKDYLDFCCEGYLNIDCTNDSQSVNLINPITEEIVDTLTLPPKSFISFGKAIELLSNLSNMENEAIEDFERKIPSFSTDSPYEYYIHTGFIIKGKFLFHSFGKEPYPFWTWSCSHILYNPISGELVKVSFDSYKDLKSLAKKVLTGFLYQKRWCNGTYKLAPMIESLIDEYAEDIECYESLKNIPLADMYNYDIYCCDINRYQHENSVQIHWAIDLNCTSLFDRPIGEYSLLEQNKISWKRGAVIEYIYYADNQEIENSPLPF